MSSPPPRCCGPGSSLTSRVLLGSVTSVAPDLGNGSVEPFSLSVMTVSSADPPRLLPQKPDLKVGPLVNTLIIVAVIIAVVLLLTGGFVPSLSFLLWLGIVLLVIAAIVFIVRSVGGRRA